MEYFRSQLKSLQSSSRKAKSWHFVSYDQLNLKFGPWSTGKRSEAGLVLVESLWKPNQRPYHKQKLAFLLTSMRHFALEAAKAGHPVVYLAGPETYAEALEGFARDHGPLNFMRPAERELRCHLGPLVQAGTLLEHPHEGWLTTPDDFITSIRGKKSWRMDSFYRVVRKRTKILMDSAGKPEGGKLSFDAENRKAWKGDPPAPEVPVFKVDRVTEEVGALIEQHFANHPGELHLETIPASQKDAAALWKWALSECLPEFGPYEDAMSTRSSNLFHTRLSPLLNLHRLLPSAILNDVLQTSLPLASKEGFVRQLIGWREFVYHIHEHTDGFRRNVPWKKSALKEPGDGGYGRWLGKDWRAKDLHPRAEGGANPSVLEHKAPLPPVFWGTESGLFCLDHVFDEVWRDGYGHHITRLMVISNWSMLLGLNPRDVTDWFWVAYIDAYDWVVEPNVLGMGTFATGDLMITKPYVSGSAYVNKMSDFCSSCAFHPKKNCPMTSMYWHFLHENKAKLEDNPRLKLVMASSRKRSDSQKELDRSVAHKVRTTLQAGEKLTPGSLAEIG